MRQDFVSNVSHGIQSQLTSISGFTPLDEQIRRIVVASEPQWSAKSISVAIETPWSAGVKITADRDQLDGGVGISSVRLDNGKVLVSFLQAVSQSGRLKRHETPGRRIAVWGRAGRGASRGQVT